MSRVLTFATKFPSYHPKAGQPTYFVEKIVSGLVAADAPEYFTDTIKYCRDKGILSIAALNELYNQPDLPYKHHTIRAGSRWKVGMKFSPRVWSGAYYRSPMIAIGPDIEIRKIWRVTFDQTGLFLKDDVGHDLLVDSLKLDEIARNDGFEKMQDFLDWFQLSPRFDQLPPFEGQILCWSDQISY